MNQKTPSIVDEGQTAGLHSTFAPRTPTGNFRSDLGVSHVPLQA